MLSGASFYLTVWNANTDLSVSGGDDIPETLTSAPRVVATMLARNSDTGELTAVTADSSGRLMMANPTFTDAYKTLLDNATDAATPSTLVKRDGSASSRFLGLFTNALDHDTPSPGGLAIGTGTGTTSVTIGKSGGTTTIWNATMAGTTTVIDSTSLQVTDRVVSVNRTAGPNAPVPTQIAGISVMRGDVSGTSRDFAGVFWDESAQAFHLAFNTAGDDIHLGTTLPIIASSFKGPSSAPAVLNANALTDSVQLSAATTTLLSASDSSGTTKLDSASRNLLVHSNATVGVSSDTGAVQWTGNSNLVRSDTFSTSGTTHQYQSGVSSVITSFAARSGTGNGVGSSQTIAAQDGQTQTSTSNNNNNGGSLNLIGGIAGTAGIPGSGSPGKINLQFGAVTPQTYLAFYPTPTSVEMVAQTQLDITSPTRLQFVGNETTFNSTTDTVFISPQVNWYWNSGNKLARSDTWAASTTMIWDASITSIATTHTQSGTVGAAAGAAQSWTAQQGQGNSSGNINGSGGAITITAGSTGTGALATGGTGGAVAVSAGPGAGGTSSGGDAQFSGGAGTGASSNGGAAFLFGGAATASGGKASVVGGAGVTGGAGGVSGGTGGSGGGGAAQLFGGNATSGNGSGGAVSIKGGSGNGTGLAGNVVLSHPSAGAYFSGIEVAAGKRISAIATAGTNVASSTTLGSVDGLLLLGNATTPITLSGVNSANKSSAGALVTVSAGVTTVIDGNGIPVDLQPTINPAGLTQNTFSAARRSLSWNPMVSVPTTSATTIYKLDLTTVTTLTSGRIGVIRIELLVTCDEGTTSGSSGTWTLSILARSSGSAFSMLTPTTLTATAVTDPRPFVTTFTAALSGTVLTVNVSSAAGAGGAAMKNVSVFATVTSVFS